MIWRGESIDREKDSVDVTLALGSAPVLRRYSTTGLWPCENRLDGLLASLRPGPAHLVTGDHEASVVVLVGDVEVGLVLAQVANNVQPALWVARVMS